MLNFYGWLATHSVFCLCRTRKRPLHSQAQVLHAYALQEFLQICYYVLGYI